MFRHHIYLDDRRIRLSDQHYGLIFQKNHCLDTFQHKGYATQASSQYGYGRVSHNADPYGKGKKQAKAIKKIQEVTLPNLRQQLAETTGIFKGKERKALEKQIQQTETELAEKLDKLPDILTDDGYPDVQAFMKTYRKAEAIVTQYNQDLAEWEQTVKNGQKPAEKQHRPPERQSVRNRLRQLQEEGKQNSQPKQRKKSQDRDR